MSPTTIRRGLAPICATLLALALLTPVAQADDSDEGKSLIDQIDKWRFQTSLLTWHTNPRDDHDNSQELVNIEVWLENKWHAGFALLDNSYSQKSQYVYIGKAWNILDSPHFYWRITGGLLHGYKDEYQDNIPLNNLGTAPAIVPAVGAQWGPVFTEIQTGGISAIMWTLGFEVK